MPNFICLTCGVQHEDSETPPDKCVICEDERQFVNWDGQQWTTLDELRLRHHNRFEDMEPRLHRIGTSPAFAIGQHAYLLQHPEGNLLWDCITLIDDDTIEVIDALGGVARIAVSHPHYYSTMVEWGLAFGGVPIYLHQADRRWVRRHDETIEFWTGDTLALGDGLTLINGGGHFDGGTMLHWAGGAGGRGALLPGDIIQVVHDRRWVSFMYSYMNLIPLSPHKVRRVVDAVEPFEFETIYSPWRGRIVERDGKEAVRRSAKRYIEAITD